VNVGYSSFGDGGWSVGGTILQAGATYDYATKKWHYSYTLDPKALEDAYKEGVQNRKFNGYGPAGGEKILFINSSIGSER
jgi:hypothetical protein